MQLPFAGRPDRAACDRLPVVYRCAALERRQLYWATQSTTCGLGIVLRGVIDRAYALYGERALCAQLTGDAFGHLVDFAVLVSPYCL